MSEDVLGEAISDYYHNNAPQKLWIHSHYGPKEEMPVHIYFRDEKDMTPLELVALKKCKGAILDIGAGAGSHALYLQQKEKEVAALEISPKACEVMRLRGITNVIEANIFQFQGQRFDTLILLMNGIGLTATIAGLQQFLRHAKALLNKGGQLLFDSSDVSYLYDGTVPLTSDYFGEILCQYRYKRLKTDWFTWLYIEQATLMHIAAKEGWKTDVIMEDEHAQYLVRLTLV